MSKIFAHRGYSGHYPENTMLAFKKSIEAGVDGIELDVHLTKDNELVIIHDETIDRTTNGSGLVADLTLKELSKFDASYKFKNIGVNPIPTLDEYLDYIKDKNIITNIELKTNINEYHGIEGKVLELIEKYSLEDKVIISSFNHFTIMRMKEIAPYLKYGLLTESWIINPGKYTNDLGVKCYHPQFKSLNSCTVDELKKYNIEINTYTVNDEEDIKDMFYKKVDVIITNYPELALSLKL